MADHPHIERHTPADSDCLLGLWESSVRRTHDFLEDGDIDAYRPMVTEGLRGTEVFVYRAEGGACVGFIVLDGARVDMLFVDPAAYRMGVGTALIEFARKERGPLSVDVNEQNRGAVAFYERKSFRVVGRSETDPTGRPYPILHMSQQQDG